MASQRFEMGWRERGGFPDLGLAVLQAKIDTGARTSAFYDSRRPRFGD